MYSAKEHRQAPLSRTTSRRCTRGPPSPRVRRRAPGCASSATRSVVVFEPIVDLRDGRIVGFEALARWNSPERGDRPAGRVHSRRRGDRPDVRDRRERPPPRLPGGAPLAGRLPGPRDVGVSVNLSPERARRRAARRRRRSGAVRGAASRREPDARDHRERRDVGPRHRPIGAWTSCASSASSSFSTTSVPGARRSSGSTASRSTCSRSPSRSSTGSSTRLGETSFIDAFVELAQSLEMQCIAEGIEEAAQVPMLLERGCSLGQGFHFAPPIDEAELNRYLRRPRRRSGWPADLRGEHRRRLGADLERRCDEGPCAPASGSGPGAVRSRPAARRSSG